MNRPLFSTPFGEAEVASSIQKGEIKFPRMAQRYTKDDMWYIHAKKTMDDRYKPSNMTTAQWKSLESAQLGEYEDLENFANCQPKGSFFIAGHATNRAIFCYRDYDTEPATAAKIAEILLSEKNGYRQRIQRAAYIIALGCNTGNEFDPPMNYQLSAIHQDPNGPKFDKDGFSTIIHCFARELCALLGKPCCGAEGFTGTANGVLPIIRSRYDHSTHQAIGSVRGWAVYYPSRTHQLLTIPALKCAPGQSIHDKWSMELLASEKTGERGYLNDLIMGSDDDWANFTERNGMRIDAQILLKYFTNLGWDCAPETTDGRYTPSMNLAIRKFQKECNQRMGSRIPETGVWDTLTWVALKNAFAKHSKIPSILETRLTA